MRLGRFCILILISFLACRCDSPKSASDLFIEKFDLVRLVSYDTHRAAVSLADTLKIESNNLEIPNVKIVDDLNLTREQLRRIIPVLTGKQPVCIMADCYNPRHCLVFYENGKLTGYYEFCVSCGGSKQSSGLGLQELCEQDGKKLIELFKQMRLKNDGEEDEDYKYF